MDLVIARGAHAPEGVLEAPPDKSISHRALIGALLVPGETELVGVSEAADVRATREAIVALGAEVAEVARGRLLVRSAGLGHLAEPADVIDVGNSGTLARLGLGVATLVPGQCVLTGDDSVRRRPMDRVLGPLRSLGAVVAGREGDRFLPAVVRGSRLRAGTVPLAVASAQVKSALLLAGLGASGPVAVIEPQPTRPHTEELLAALGVAVEVEPREGLGQLVRVEPSVPRSPGRIDVAGDPSAAAFFVVGAAADPGARLEVRGAYLGPTRTGYLEVLARMGARIDRVGRDTLLVHGARLEATDIGPEEVPSLVDEVPVLGVAFALARGTSRLRGAGELRVKESDRIETTASLLRALGARVRTVPDGFDVVGPARPPERILVASERDHRIAMSAAIAAAVLGAELVVTDAEWIRTSYPGFVEDFARLCGADVVGWGP